MGLVLCKQFCVLLGGDISVTSEIGEGATFRVRLPRRATGLLKRGPGDAPQPERRNPIYPGAPARARHGHEGRAVRS